MGDCLYRERLAVMWIAPAAMSACERCERPLFHAKPTLEATQGQVDGFIRQLPYKCQQNRVASVRLTDDLPLSYLQGGSGMNTSIWYEQIPPSKIWYKYTLQQYCFYCQTACVDDSIWYQ